MVTMVAPSVAAMVKASRFLNDINGLYVALSAGSSYCLNAAVTLSLTPDHMQLPHINFYNWSVMQLNRLVRQTFVPGLQLFAAIVGSCCPDIVALPETGAAGAFNSDRPMSSLGLHAFDSRHVVDRQLASGTPEGGYYRREPLSSVSQN